MWMCNQLLNLTYNSSGRGIARNISQRWHLRSILEAVHCYQYRTTARWVLLCPFPVEGQPPVSSYQPLNMCSSNQSSSSQTSIYFYAQQVPGDYCGPRTPWLHRESRPYNRRLQMLPLHSTSRSPEEFTNYSTPYSVWLQLPAIQETSQLEWLSAHRWTPVEWPLLHRATISATPHWIMYRHWKSFFTHLASQGRQELDQILMAEQPLGVSYRHIDLKLYCLGLFVRHLC